MKMEYWTLVKEQEGWSIRNPLEYNKGNFASAVYSSAWSYPMKWFWSFSEIHIKHKPPI